MSQTTATRPARNGVDVPKLSATLDAVREAPAAAKFQFRATNRWISGTHSQTTIHSFFGAGEERTHKQAYTYHADHPEVLTGQDNAPAPIEFLLHGLAACLTSGIGNIASMRGVDLDYVESTIEGDIDLNGILGLSDDARNGYEQVRVNFRIAGNADDETLRAIVEQSRKRSAVYDVMTNGVPVEISVDTV